MRFPTRTTWVLSALILATLDEVLFTLPASAGFHATPEVTFGIAVAALVCAILAALNLGHAGA